MATVEIDKDDFESKLNKALILTAIQVADSMKGKLDGDHGVFTGDLKASISWKVEGNSIIIEMLGRGKYVEWGCFFDEYTLIHTKFGEIRIRDLRLGDLIKTESGYKKLIQKEKIELGYPVNAVIIETESGKILEVTEDHPIKTVKGWKKARDLNKEDHLYIEDGI